MEIVVHPASDNCSLEWVPTMKQVRAHSKGKYNTISSKIDNFVSQLYWTYYVHLPFYIMTSDDAFIVHLLFLSVFSLGIFGIIKYCFL